MIVGASVVELHIEGCRSLKAKRGVVRSIVRRVRNRFNLSVAEVGGQDTWQYAVLGLAAAGFEAGLVRSVLERASARDVDITQWGPADFGFSRGEPGLMATPAIRP